LCGDKYGNVWESGGRHFVEELWYNYCGPVVVASVNFIASERQAMIWAKYATKI
jgi:hypothetical protein